MKKENIHIDIDEEIITFVENLIDKKENFFVTKINEIVCYLLKEEMLEAEEISVCITKEDKEGIRKLNREYRGIDKTTDVLSFPIFEKDELEAIRKETDENKKIKLLELGDIILCMDVVEKQAVEYGTGILRETLYMITHGMCHLLGYDHIVQEDKIIMRSLENKVMQYIGVE